MGKLKSVVTGQEKQPDLDLDLEKEDLAHARARFKSNYLTLAGEGAPLAWLEENIGPLLRLAVPDFDQALRLENLTRPQVRPAQQGKIFLVTSQQFINFYSNYEPEAVALAG